jgi:uncharacterized protein YjbI with pentapeptide repeats
MAQTTDEMAAIAERSGLLVDGRIDLRGLSIRFNHSGLDLRRFNLEGANLSGSRLVNCLGEGVSFRGCTLNQTWIAADPGETASFENACFDNTELNDTTFGPRTLDLRGTTFRNAKLKEVTFRMARMNDASFLGADLEDVYFRSGILNGVDFSNSRLCRVSFEKAVLDGVNFRGVVADQMDFWGHKELFEPTQEQSN